MSKQKVDLTVLKRLVSELESILVSAEDIKADMADDKVEYIVELSKATGICAGILTESGLLLGDIQCLLQGFSAPNQSKSDFMEKLFSGFKGPGSTN